MCPLNDIQYIYDNESHSENRHIIMLLFVKPGDEDSDRYHSLFNYWNRKSDKYCNIYLVGYSEYQMSYDDCRKIECSIAGNYLYYSDTCFLTVIESLKSKLKKWEYSGEPELIVLQNRDGTYGSNTLNFSNYVYIDINYGLKHGYIDSFPRFMERLLSACKKEVDVLELMESEKKKRLKPRAVILDAIDECPKLPKAAKRIIKDRLFYKTYRG